jgi:hypothetical protein
VLYTGATTPLHLDSTLNYDGLFRSSQLYAYAPSYNTAITGTSAGTGIGIYGISGGGSIGVEGYSNGGIGVKGITNSVSSSGVWAESWGIGLSAKSHGTGAGISIYAAKGIGLVINDSASNANDILDCQYNFSNTFRVLANGTAQYVGNKNSLLTSQTLIPKSAADSLYLKTTDSALWKLETKTHAAATYQPKGSISSVNYIHFNKSSKYDYSTGDTGKAFRDNKNIYLMDDSTQGQTLVESAYGEIHGLGNSVSSAWSSPTILSSGTTTNNKYVASSSNTSIISTGGDGIYYIYFRGSVTIAGTASVTVYLYKNGSAISAATNSVTVSSSSYAFNLGTYPIIVSLNTNDKISVYSSCTQTGGTYGFGSGNLIMYRIGR